MSDLTDTNLLEIVRALRVGEISSRELTTAYLDRIDRLEPHLQAFISLTPSKALAQADQADARLLEWRKSGQDLGDLPPLLGVPLAVKDVLTVADTRSTAGSKTLETFFPPYNATCVERLLDAGMVLLGKTNTDEFAMGSSTENSAYKVTHNPWDLSRVPGGSSGGSAAAVAAQMAPIALGTDTGGSVRQPASYCGVSGLKPTYGRVSRYGLIAFGSSLDTVGVLGRTVEGVARALEVIAGRDALDSTSANLPVAETSDVLKNVSRLDRLRIGVPQEYFVQGIQSEVDAAVRGAIDVLVSLGAEVESVSLPHTQYAVAVYYMVATAEASANLARYDGVRYGPRADAESIGDLFRRTRGRLFGQEVKRRIMLGTYALSAGYYDAYYGKAQRVRTLIRRDFEAAFENVDVVAAPVAPTTAFKIGQHSDDPLAMYLEDVLTIPANLAAVPGLAFPVGFDHQGLPIGMQLMGPHFREDLILRIGHAYQQITDWHKRKPEL
ncbi:MAG: Asp-tRNA(Asn)/Glu-tRNA(Gln) amidotransferase subunit GatA [Anaerolineales bacterium]|jgi:aspartyl-tRNA(Asn)/glutamyl-tRNA(Gln) amidotransferase subunit A